MVDDTEFRDLIADERAEFARVLAGLPADAWDTSSLCAGWRVREVVAHMTMPFRLSPPRFLWGVLRDRGDVNRFADRMARRDAARLSAADLARCLAGNVRHPWRPPGGGFEGALIHDIVHSLDVTIPLGIDRRLPDARLRVLTRMGSARGVRFFGVDLTGVQLCADDFDWTYGDGEPLRGRAQDLALVVFGWRLPAGRLRGAASARFTRSVA